MADKVTIKRIISKQEKTANTLYKYEVVDEAGNKQIVASVQKYDLGERAIVIWSKLSDQYNTPYLKRVRNITVDKD
jgi:hypothetical protein